MGSVRPPKCELLRRSHRQMQPPNPNPRPSNQTSGGRGGGPGYHAKGRGRGGKREAFIEAVNNIVMKSDHKSDHYELINVLIYTLPNTRKQYTVNDRMKNVHRALIDSGAVQGNYISKEAARELIQHGTEKQPCHSIICSAFQHVCQRCLGIVDVGVRYFNEIINDYSYMRLSCTIINTDYDIIIGLQAIRKNSLTVAIQSHFLEKDVLRTCQLPALSTSGDLELERQVPKGKVSALTDRISRIHLEGSSVSQATSRGLFPPQSVLGEHAILGRICGKEEFLDSTPDDDYITERPTITELLPPWVPTEVETASVKGVEPMYSASTTASNKHNATGQTPDSLSNPTEVNSKRTHTSTEGVDETHEESPIPTDIQGDAEAVKLLRDLCMEYVDIFSRQLRAEPAKLPPMKIKVDEAAWQSKKTQAPARRQSTRYNEEIRKQVDNMLKHGIIKKGSRGH